MGRLARRVVHTAIYSWIFAALFLLPPAIDADADRAVSSMVGSDPPTVSVGASGSPPRTAARVSDLHHTDARAAALLMSGQRGGGIEGVLVIGLPSTDDDLSRVPFWIELGNLPRLRQGGAATRTFEIFLYVIDDQSEVESFQARALHLDLSAQDPDSTTGLRFQGDLPASAAAREIRVLVLDRLGNEFFLDSRPIPLRDRGSDTRRGTVLFPDHGTPWIEVHSNPELPAAESDASMTDVTPLGQPVVVSRSSVRFFVVVPAGDEPVAIADGRLRRPDGRQRHAGALDVIDRTPNRHDGSEVVTLEWQVPELLPGQYSLEITLTGRGDLHAGTPLIAVTPDLVDAYPTWVAYAASSRRAAPQRRVVTTNLSYTDALMLGASGEWDEAVAAVYDLERRTLSDGVDRIVRGGHSDLEAARLIKLEESVVKALVARDPDAAIPLLLLHHDILTASIAADDILGQHHSVHLMISIARRIGKRSKTSGSTAAAVAMLSSAANTLYNPTQPEMTLALLEQALELEPDHQPSRIGAAAVHEWFGRYDEAAEILSGVTRRPDLLFEARLHYAVNLYRTGKEREAVTELRRCTHRTAPSWIRVVAYQELVLQQLDTGRPEQAAAIIEEAIREIPDDQGLLLLQAYVEEIRGNRGASRSILGAFAQRTGSLYRESPRRRYTLWPTEIFELDLRDAREVAHGHLPDLAAALASLGS